MRVLLDHAFPFMLAHGGFQIQIEQTLAALREIGVQADCLRWWDEKQKADLIHFFGMPRISYLNYCREKDIRVVVSVLLTGLGSKPPLSRWTRKWTYAAGRRLLPRNVRMHFGWEVYIMADACIALTPWEAALMSGLFRTPADNLHVVPNGVEKVFLESNPQPRENWLVCTATITDRKRVAELAAAAVVAGTPVWIIGKPYSETDPYGARFLELARQHPDKVRYEGPVQDRTTMARIYRQARGFVLLSDRESLSLSALEAAACECPLLLSDLPWARTVFKDKASYCPVTRSTAKTAALLRQFYDAAPSLPIPEKPATWTDVAKQLAGIYEALLNTSR